MHDWTPEQEPTVEQWQLWTLNLLGLVYALLPSDSLECAQFIDSWRHVEANPEHYPPNPGIGEVEDDPRLKALCHDAWDAVQDVYWEAIA